MADTIIEITGGMFDSTEVTETVDGFPVGNKAVGSDFFAKMISTLYGNGVAVNGDEKALKITAGSGMNLLCMPGAAWIHGYMAWNKEILPLPISGGQNYIICLRLNLSAGTYSIVCAENPAPEVYPVRNDILYDLVLAKAAVPENAVSGSDASIEDCRYNIELCGVVTSAADGLNTIAFASNAGLLDDHTADEFLLKAGGSMTGKLLAAAENTGIAAVRNISYGTSVPENLRNGEIFILLS